MKSTIPTAYITCTKLQLIRVFHPKGQSNTVNHYHPTDEFVFQTGQKSTSLEERLQNIFDHNKRCSHCTHNVYEAPPHQNFPLHQGQSDIITQQPCVSSVCFSTNQNQPSEDRLRFSFHHKDHHSHYIHSVYYTLAHHNFPPMPCPKSTQHDMQSQTRSVAQNFCNKKRHFLCTIELNHLMSSIEAVCNKHEQKRHFLHILRLNVLISSIQT